MAVDIAATLNEIMAWPVPVQIELLRPLSQVDGLGVSFESTGETFETPVVPTSFCGK